MSAMDQHLSQWKDLEHELMTQATEAITPANVARIWEGVNMVRQSCFPLMNWDADIEVEEQWPEDSDLKLTGIAWENALYFDGPDFDEALEGGIYHQRFADGFLVGIRFEFNAAGDDCVSATAFVHPAEDHRGDYYTHTDCTLLTADVKIKPHSRSTLKALQDRTA